MPRRSEPTVAPAPAPDFSTSLSTDRPPALLTEPTVSAPLPGGSSTSYIPPETGSSNTTAEPYSAFRPLVNGSPWTPPPNSAQAPVMSEKPPETHGNVSKQEVDNLNRRIAELEKALTETEERVKQATTPIPFAQQETGTVSPDANHPFLQAFSAENTETTEAETMEASKPVLPTPVIDIPGVIVTSNEKKVRIEVPDSALFLSGTWQLSPEAEDTLRRIVGEIRANFPEASLEIEGHTDSIIRDPSNTTQKHDVASHKAMVVLQYFIQSLQWNAEKIRSSSFGPSRPATDNGTPEGRARNNRIEIVVSP